MTADSTSRPLCPMHRTTCPESGPPRLGTLAAGTPVRLVTRYHDVRQVLMDQRFDRSSLNAEDAPPLLAVPNLLSDADGLVNQDGPDHQRASRTRKEGLGPRACSRRV